MAGDGAGLSVAALIGALPALAWMAYAASYLFRIGLAAGSVLRITPVGGNLGRGLGLWPLPKLALILLLLVVLRRWGGLRRVPWPSSALLDRSV